MISQCPVCGNEYPFFVHSCRLGICPYCCEEGLCPYQDECLYWELSTKMKAMDYNELEKFKYQFIKILSITIANDENGRKWFIIGGHAILADIILTLDRSKDPDYTKKYICAILKRLCGGVRKLI